MNRALKGACLALSLTLASVAGTAQAVTYTVTMTGTVTGGFDFIGAFGSDPLVGRSIRAVFQVDTSKGTLIDDNVIQYTEGNDLDKPVWSTFQMTGTGLFEMPSDRGYGVVRRDDYSPLFSVSAYLLESTDQISQSQQQYISHYIYISGKNGAFTGTSLGPPTDITFGPNAVPQGQFEIRQLYQSKHGNGYNAGARVIYRPDSFTVTSGSVVPEPQIWAMLVIGFGVTGVALQQGRRARAKTALAT
ncbi:hypothetical protein [Phenylobacterium sp.]|jgi:hypothetical protein|uniref:hypothetical protein n=1 Tax=Phenylobacterium sp. TaxID=1871053 RepID=UPI0037C89641